VARTGNSGELQSGETEQRQRRKTKGIFPRDLFVILENCRDLSVKTI
jgi:hypothetical protein